MAKNSEICGTNYKKAPSKNVHFKEKSTVLLEHVSDMICVFAVH